jgi:Tfp pilus assembly pilus retraction ATPase PilT
MITGKAAGMQLLDDSLRSLAAAGLIAEEEVASRSFNRLQAAPGR